MIGTLLLPIMTVGCADDGATNYSPAEEQEKTTLTTPNILFITTDQQSYTTISALSDKYRDDANYSPTPNIDRLVRSGISFTNAYCANPVSVPSRFSMYTGLIGGGFAVRCNTFDSSSSYPNYSAADETRIRAVVAANGMGHHFVKAGYETIYAGKVHLPFPSESSSSKYVHPTAYGFQSYLTDDEREGLGIAVAEFISAREASDTPFLLAANFINPHDIGFEQSSYEAGVIEDDADPEIVSVVTTLRQMIEDEIAATSSDYFYSDIAPKLPFNLEPTEDYPTGFFKASKYKSFSDEYWQRYRYIYSGMVNLVDEHIGLILDALDANPELKANTIVVFTSDHGEMQGAHRMVTKNYPYEECQRIPLIFSGAGIKSANATNNSLVCNGTDILPTICDMAGVTPPNRIEGISLAGHLMQGWDAPDQREYLFTDGDGFSNIIKDGYKYTYFDQTGEEMLVKISTDDGELENIAPTNPSKAAELRTLLDAAWCSF